MCSARAWLASLFGLLRHPPHPSGAPMSRTIRDKTILITGANRGIGRAFAEVYLEHGAEKIYAAVRQVESAAPLLEVYGGKVQPLQLDLTDPASVQSAAGIARDVDIVINNAGAFQKVSPLAEDAVDVLRLLMDINVYGLIRMAQAFAPVLQTNGGGVFVQLNSVVSLRASAQGAAYSASKAAAYSITQALGTLLSGQGTRVVSVFPGPIDTDMGEQAGVKHLAVPPEVVAYSLADALEQGDFHVFPDPFARQMGDAYRHFAEYVEEVIG